MDEPDQASIDNLIDYRCKKCSSIVPRGAHHRMSSCPCGAVMVDRGWYGSRVLWKGDKREDVVEEIVGVRARGVEKITSS